VKTYLQNISLISENYLTNEQYMKGYDAQWQKNNFIIRRLRVQIQLPLLATGNSLAYQLGMT
jgi:hypothetical protein